MTMKQGKGAIVAKERGTKRVLKFYIAEFIRRVEREITDFIIIGYTSYTNIADILKKKIIDETNFKGEIYIMQMGVAVGTHVGLGGLSMYFIEKEHLRDSLVNNTIKSIGDKKDEIIEKIKH